MERNEKQWSKVTKFGDLELFDERSGSTLEDVPIKASLNNIDQDEVMALLLKSRETLCNVSLDFLPRFLQNARSLEDYQDLISQPLTAPSRELAELSWDFPNLVSFKLLTTGQSGSSEPSVRLWSR